MDRAERCPDGAGLADPVDIPGLGQPGWPGIQPHAAAVLLLLLVVVVVVKVVVVLLLLLRPSGSCRGCPLGWRLCQRAAHQ